MYSNEELVYILELPLRKENRLVDHTNAVKPTDFVSEQYKRMKFHTVAAAQQPILSGMTAPSFNSKHNSPLLIPYINRII